MDKEQFSKELGLRLRAARAARGWSLAAAAKASEGRWSAPAIGSYERGERGVTPEQLSDLARFYGVATLSLIPGAEQVSVAVRPAA